MSDLQSATEKARSIVNKFTLGATGAAFIPGSTLLLAGADVVMVNEIAKAFGCDKVEAEAFIASIAATVAGKTAANALLEFIPLAKNVVAGVGTKALGEAAIQYFKPKSPYR